MNKACMKWNDRLLEAALAEVGDRELNEHLSQCADCATKLQALRDRNAQLDRLLPLLAKPAGRTPDLHTRIMAAAETPATRRKSGLWWQWVPAGAVTVVILAATLGWIWQQKRYAAEAELHAAQELAHWRSPTQSLLQVPGREFLTNTPKLGESYMNVHTRTEKEERNDKKNRL